MDTKTSSPKQPVRVATDVEPSLAEKLQASAFHHDRTIAAEIRVALRDYLSPLNTIEEENTDG